MNMLIMFIAAILPAALLFMYIWKKDIQKEPTSLLVKAVLYGAAICIPVAGFEQAIHTILFGVDGEPTSLVGSTAMAFFLAACVLFVPVLAHGIYDSLAMSGMVNQYIGGACFFVLIYFCIKMHKVAKGKVLALVDKDRYHDNYESI